MRMYGAEILEGLENPRKFGIMKAEAIGRGWRDAAANGLFKPGAIAVQSL